MPARAGLQGRHDQRWVNDAPAEDADVGIAVDDATCRQYSADIQLTEPGLAAIIDDIVIARESSCASKTSSPTSAATLQLRCSSLSRYLPLSIDYQAADSTDEVWRMPHARADADAHHAAERLNYGRHRLRQRDAVADPMCVEPQSALYSRRRAGSRGVPVVSAAFVGTSHLERARQLLPGCGAWRPQLRSDHRQHLPKGVCERLPYPLQCPNGRALVLGEHAP